MEGAHCLQEELRLRVRPCQQGAVANSQSPQVKLRGPYE